MTINAIQDWDDSESNQSSKAAKLNKLYLASRLKDFFFNINWNLKPNIVEYIIFK